MNPEQLGQKLAELLRKWGLLPAKPALRPIPVRPSRPSRPRRSSSRR